MRESIRGVTEDLCVWYAEIMPGLERRNPLDQYELLLCASDLRIDSPAIRRSLTSLLRQAQREEPSDIPILHSIVRLLVFTRFGVGEEARRTFLHYWVNSGEFRSQGLFVAAAFVSLALMNQTFLTPEASESVRKWYLKHKRLKSDMLASWAPFCLQMAGHRTEARTRALESLSRRQRDGSWGQERKRTIACAYALALSGVVSSEELDASIEYIASRFAQGIITELSLRCQLLRLLCVMCSLTDDQLRRLRDRLGKAQTVFVSYSRKDMETADRLVEYLEDRGYMMWIDRSRIGLGDEWPERLAAGVNACETVLMLISESALNSDYCSKEILYAIKKRKPVVAAHLDRTPLPDKIDLMLGNIQRPTAPDYLDFEEFLCAVDQGLQRLQLQQERN